MVRNFKVAATKRTGDSDEDATVDSVATFHSISVVSYKIITIRGYCNCGHLNRGYWYLLRELLELFAKAVHLLERIFI